MSRNAKWAPREIDEQSLHRMARIIGPSSASSLALADLECRRANGEDAAVYLYCETFIVGPKILDVKDTK